MSDDLDPFDEAIYERQILAFNIFHDVDIEVLRDFAARKINPLAEIERLRAEVKQARKILGEEWSDRTAAFGEAAKGAESRGYLAFAEALRAKAKEVRGE